MPITVSLCNAKGGVGKTSLTLALASAAAASHLRVLVIDMDRQGTASEALGYPDTIQHATTYDVMATRTPGCAAGAIVASTWDNVDVLPADDSLVAHDGGDTPAEALRVGLDGAVEDYNLVLFDCPPSVAHLTLNALTASDLAPVVTEPSKPESRGVLETVHDGVRRSRTERRPGPADPQPARPAATRLRQQDRLPLGPFHSHRWA